MLAASFAKACRESDVGTVLLWLFEDSTLREVINSKDETGKTALHHTCRNGNIKLLTLLLLNGADIVERDDDGHTALFDAFETGHISRILDTILALVLERRTCFSIGTFQAVVSEILNLPTIAFSLKEKYQFLLKSNNFTNSSNLRGKSLLHIAWDKNDLDMVEYLLSIGADSTGVDEYGNQALPKGESHIYYKYTLPDGADPVVHQVTFNEDGFQGGWLTGSKAYLDYIFLHFAQLSTLVLINIDMFQHNMSQGPGTYPNCEVFISVNCNLHFLPVMPKLQKLSLYTTKFNDKYSKTHMHDTEWSNLQSLIIRNTFINNIKKWNFLKLTKFVMSGSKHSLLPESLEKCEMLDELVVTNNRLAQLPQNLPSTLKILDCSYNRLETLPVPIAHLKQLSVFEFKGNQNLILPPISLSRNSLKQKLCYLQKFLEEKDENNLVKVVLIGEEGVGKSTLLTSLSRQGLQLSQGCLPDKTDGIDIKELSHQDIQFKFFDFAGDKEFLETHMLFVSEYTIYLCVYDMSRFALQTDNPLGRLELWLENIFIKCPNSVCILIGTHCDSDVVCNELKSMITTKLEKWFDKVRNTHKEKFQENGIEDCLLGCFLENVDANQNFKVRAP